MPRDSDPTVTSHRGASPLLPGFAPIGEHVDDLGLMAQSSEQQRTHLEQRLGQVRKDFSELKCMQ